MQQGNLPGRACSLRVPCPSGPGHQKQRGRSQERALIMTATQPPEQPVVAWHSHGTDHPHYHPGGETMHTHQPTAKPEKKRRVFLWVFLAIQVIFIAMIVFWATRSTGILPGEIQQTCGGGKWYPLWKSYSDCAAHSGAIAAHDTAKGIAIVGTIVAWVVVDFLVGLTYLIYRLAKR